MEARLDEELRDATRDASVVVLARKSWVAFVRPVGLASALAIGGCAAVFERNAWVALAILAAGLAFAAMRFLELRSVVLFHDDDGVWIQSGIFPWTRGIRGMRFRDLDDPVIVQSFASWLLRSHSIVLRHRFTRDAELVLPDMADAARAVSVLYEATR